MQDFQHTAPQSCHMGSIVDLLIVAGKKFGQNCKISVLEISSSKTVNQNGTEIWTI